MESEDIAVQRALIHAGHGHRPAASRGELHSTLIDLYHEDVSNEDLVEHLRSILDVADRREWETEAKAEFMAQTCLKGCPSCDRKPVIGPCNRISCQACQEAPGAGGLTLIESLLSWNDDEDWLRMGAPVDRFGKRTAYTLPPEVVKARTLVAGE